MDIRNVFRTYSGLPRSIYIIFFSRIANCIGNFVFPLMTLLLTIKMGMSEKEVGFFLLVCSLVQVPGSLIGGKFADNFGRKKIIITFMLLSALTFITCAFLGNSTLVPILLIFASLFNSVSGPASGAMVNDLTVPENRQASFSLLYLGINVGSAIGSIVAGFLFTNYMVILYIGDAVTTFIAVFLLIKYVKESKPSKEQIKDSFNIKTTEKAEEGGMIGALLRRPALLIFAVISTVYSFVYAQTHFSIPLQATQVFGAIHGPQYFGTFNTVNCIVVIVMTTLITSLTKRVRAIYNVALAGVFYAVGFGMLFFARSYWLFLISTIIWTLGEILSATNSSVYIANHTPISHRGRFNSIIHLITGTGFAVSPLIIGGYITQFGVVNVWPIIFALSASSAFCMFLLGLSEKRKARIKEEAEYIQNEAEYS